MSNKNIFKSTETDNEIDLKEGKVSKEESSLLPVHISTTAVTKLDRKTIDAKYYNSFNFSKLASVFGNSKMTIGVTSANKNDGKTLVAANMGVSLASGYKQKTLLIDMNFTRPSLHKVFGTKLSPGIAEAIYFQKIRVIPTTINNLYLMTAGDCKTLTPGIEHTLVVRQILFALKNHFDFVIIDMSSILPINDFPIHFINEIDGLISVIDSKKTKKGEFKKIFKHLDETQFIGYVFNRVSKS
jgi:Mrp family chromosome partitioning ATPase